MWLIIITFVIISILFYYKEMRKPKNYPPGPDWQPIIGCAGELKKLSKQFGAQYLAFSELAKQYKTDVLGLKLGGQLVCVAFGYEAIRTLFTNEDFEGRPNDFFAQLRCMGQRRGVTSMDGPIWVDQRQFVLRHLRKIGFGKTEMKQMIENETLTILETLEENANSIQLEPILARSVTNILWYFTTGQTFSRNNPRFDYFLKLMNERTVAFDISGSTIGHMPWLRYIIPEKIGYNLIKRVNREMREFLVKIIDEHFENWYPDRDDDLIYAFISEMKQNQDEEKRKIYTYDQLIMICLDLFIAGTGTTSHTLDFMFLQMILHPEIQNKAAKDIENSFNYDEFITYADRIKVPYLEAIIMEVERVNGIVPVAGPRRVLKDTTFQGYNIPKDTTVLISLYSVFYDPKYWGDPEVFRPERFLDENGNLSYKDRFINFGLGKRRCLGELLARQCIFVFLTNILRKYKICPVSENEMPSSKPVPGLILSTQKYNVKLIKRKTINDT